MIEQVATVNEQNHVTGYKAKKDLRHKDCWRAACVWIEDGKGNVLMQKRSASRKVDPLKWTCAVIGTVTGDDSYESTAKREVYEEIGIKNMILKPANTVRCKSSFGYRWYKGFTATLNVPPTSFTIADEEVAEIAWMNSETVLAEIEAGDPKYATTAYSYKALFNL